MAFASPTFDPDRGRFSTHVHQSLRRDALASLKVASGHKKPKGLHQPLRRDGSCFTITRAVQLALEAQKEASTAQAR
jgi:hypothetical protein